MSMNDPVADFLTRIRNAQQARHRWADIPSSNLKTRITHAVKVPNERAYSDVYSIRREILFNHDKNKKYNLNGDLK